jgi:EAL and modified HD-GYP domain-containing signal transduction protein
MLRSMLDRLRRQSTDLGAPQAGHRTPQGHAVPGENPRPSLSRIAVGAHRPLVSAGGEIAGFEFRIADATLQRLAARADPTAARAGATSLLAAMRLCTEAGQVAYAELPASWLGLIDASEWHPGMHGALATHPGIDAPAPAEARAALAAWRRAGAAVGWRAAPPALADERPDFLVLPREDDRDRLVAAVEHCRQHHPGVALIAPDLPNLDLLERALQAGIVYAACRVDGRAEPRESHALPPRARHLLALMARLARDADSAEVVEAVKADVGLSYRLLRQLNSAAVAPAVELGSIEQAVALLGRNELYRWVSALLVREGPRRPAAAALQRMALARARFFELLAEARGHTPAGALFTLGLASMLPQLLQVRMEDALASLHLHPQALSALLERDGPWADYLTLAEVLDEGDLIEAGPLAGSAGGLPALMALVAKAWLFASRA